MRGAELLFLINVTEDIVNVERKEKEFGMLYIFVFCFQMTQKLLQS